MDSVKSFGEQKQRVVDLLAEAYALDVISESELELRLEQAERSHTSRELAALIEDLPRELQTRPVPAPGLRLSDAPQEIRLAGGSLRRRGAWLSSSSARITSSLGTVKLDLPAEVLGAGPAIHLDIDVSLGRCVIFVPPGTIVEDRLSVEFGRFRVARRVRAAGSAGDAPGRLMLTGKVRYGRLVVRKLRRRRR